MSKVKHVHADAPGYYPERICACGANFEKGQWRTARRNHYKAIFAGMTSVSPEALAEYHAGAEDEAF